MNAALGLWLMAAPAVLEYGAPAQTNDRIVGPVIITFAVVSWWEATREVRLWNLPLGAWLLVAPWLLGYSTTPTINSIAVGLLVMGLSCVRGTVEGQFGGGWSALWRSDTLHEQAARARHEERPSDRSENH